MTGSRLPRRGVLAAGLAGALLPALGCEGPQVPAPDSPLRLATGPEGAVYREIGQAIADVVNREWPQAQLELLYTDASWENIRLLNRGEVELVLMNIDIAESEGSGALALGRLFESVFHVVVPADAGVRSLWDLDGREIACGLPLSGSRFTAQAIFEVVGIRPRLRDYSQAASATALMDGEVEAVVSLTGMPTPALAQLGEHGGFALLSLADVVEEVVAATPMHYMPVTVPVSMYPGLGSAQTLAVPTLLGADARLPEEIAWRLTGLVFDHAAELSQVRPEAGQINVRTGAATVPVPLHPGAARWFREHKP